MPFEVIHAVYLKSNSTAIYLQSSGIFTIWENRIAQAREARLFLSGLKKKIMLLHNFFFPLILEQEPIDLPYHDSFMFCFSKALSSMLLKGNACDKDCLKEVKR